MYVAKIEAETGWNMKTEQFQLWGWQADPVADWVEVIGSGTWSG